MIDPGTLAGAAFPGPAEALARSAGRWRAANRVELGESGAADDPILQAVAARQDSLKVFVASRMRRGILSSERAAAIAAIDSTGFARAWAWEREATGTRSVEAICVDHAQASDALVLILTGSASPLAAREYAAALRAGAHCFILLRDGTKRTPQLVEFLANEKGRAEIATFGNLAELETQLVRVMREHVTRMTRTIRIQNYLAHRRMGGEHR